MRRTSGSVSNRFDRGISARTCRTLAQCANVVVREVEGSKASNMVQHATETTGHPEDHLDPEPSTRVRPAQHALSSRFLSQLAFFTDGIGWVHTLESWRRHGVLARFASAASRGVELG